MHIETERLHITDLTPDMAEAVHRNSLDEDVRRFVPDEVFETLEAARDAIAWLIDCQKGPEGPFIHPVLLKTGENIGYVQACRLDSGWEIGYHIAKAYTGKGYATEAVRAFVPVMLDRLGVDAIEGICLEENAGSCRVLEKCGFSLLAAAAGPYQGVDRPIRRYRFSR